MKRKTPRRDATENKNRLELFFKGHELRDEMDLLFFFVEFHEDFIDPQVT